MEKITFDQRPETGKSRDPLDISGCSQRDHEPRPFSCPHTQGKSSVGRLCPCSSCGVNVMMDRVRVSGGASGMEKMDSLSWVLPKL